MDPWSTAESQPLQYCSVCVDAGRCRVGVSSEVLWTPRRLRVAVVCPAVERGAPTVAQGGWVAKVFDEVLAQLPINLDRGAITRELSVQYRRPVPIERELEIEAWVVSEEGRYTGVHGEMRLLPAGAVLATAQASFVNVDLDHYRRHQQWLAEQEGTST